MRKMKTEIFICSKPLQYLNLLNVIKTIDNNCRKVLIIIGYFANSEQFYRNVYEKTSDWDKVYYVKNKYIAFLYLFLLSSINVYVEVDNSAVLGVVRFIKRFNVFVFEEGIGTYLPHAQRSETLLNSFYKLLGIGETYCTSKYFKGLFLYKPEVYTKIMGKNGVPLIKMKYDFLDLVEERKEQLLAIFEIDIKNDVIWTIKSKRILLYLTEWALDETILEQIEDNKDNYDYVFIKPHPHNKVVSPLLSGYNVIATPIMAEVLIATILYNENELTVYHQGSTSVIYFGGEIKSIVFPSKDISVTSYNGLDFQSLSILFCQ